MIFSRFSRKSPGIFHYFWSDLEVVTARIAKRVKVIIFTGVCHSFCSTAGGGGGGTKSECLPPPSGTRSEHLPPRTRSEHLTPPLDQVRMSTPSPLGLGQNIYRPPSGPNQNVYPPSGPSQNVYPLPLDQVRMSIPSPQTTRGRAVRILLECILVININLQTYWVSYEQKMDPFNYTAN